MLCLVLLAIFSIPLVNGREETDQEDKTKCMDELVRWCNSMEYSQTGMGMSVVSVNYGDSSVFYRMMCVTDSEGTNCTRNGLLWFACSPDHTLTYKGKVLTDPPQDIDDDICNTTYMAFHRLHIQNMAHNMTALGTKLENEFKSFQDEMDAMLKQLYDTLGFVNRDLWKGLEDDNFPFSHHDYAEPNDTDSEEDSEEDSKEDSKDSNEVERE